MMHMVHDGRRGEGVGGEVGCTHIRVGLQHYQNSKFLSTSTSVLIQRKSMLLDILFFPVSWQYRSDASGWQIESSLPRPENPKVSAFSAKAPKS